ncbi:DUF2884 family protein [Microbulbifer agarilyticus]
MKPILPFTFAALATLATVTFAAEDISISHDGNSCNASMHHQVTVGPDFLEVRDENDLAPLIAFSEPDQLAVGDDGLTLTADQQKLMRQYQQQLHHTGEEVSLLAVAAVDVALEGLGIALTALAGPNDPDTEYFLHESSLIRSEVIEKLQHPGDVYSFGTPWVEGVLESTLEEELEPRIAALATRSAGKIAWHAMKAVFTGGGSIEARAEAAAEEAEALVEEKAEALEARADALCAQMESLDTLETELHRAIPELNGLDLIKFDRQG